MTKIFCILMLAAICQPYLARAQGFVGERRDEVNVHAWRCEYCPKPEPRELGLKANLGVADEKLYRFANYSGLDGQADVFIDGDLRMRSENGDFWDMRFQHIGLDSAGVEAAYGQQGHYRIGLDYLTIPVRKYENLQTPYSYDNQVLQLPGDWPSSLDARDFASPGLYQSFATGTDWERLGLELSLNEHPWFDFDSRYQRWHKQGTREISAAQLLYATYLPLPVDERIQDLSASVSLDNAPWSMSLTAAISRFDNEFDSLRFDNPYASLIPGAETGELSLAPDNRALKLAAHGQYSYAQASFVKLDYSFAELTQDEAFLPYSTNPNLFQALPRAQLDGKVHTSDLALKLQHSWDRQWAMRLKYRKQDRDNLTDPLLLTPVIADLYLADALTTLPYDFSTQTANVTLDYRPMVGHRLNLGYRYQDKTRNLQAVHKSEEAGVNIGYSANLSPQWLLKFSGERLDRDSSAPQQVDFLGVDENPLMRRFNVADRQQDKARLQLFYTPSELISVTMSGLLSHQDYAASELGLTDNNLRNVSLDIGWHPTQTLDISVFLQHEQIETELVGSDDFSIPRWQVTNEDEIVHYGATLVLRDLWDDRLDLHLSVDRADGRSKISLNRDAQGNTLPSISSLWSHGKLTLVYRLSTNSDISLSYQYQAFDSADFAIDGVVPGSLPNLLTFGALSNDYHINYALVSLGYRF